MKLVDKELYQEAFGEGFQGMRVDIDFLFNESIIHICRGENYKAKEYCHDSIMWSLAYIYLKHCA